MGVKANKKSLLKLLKKVGVKAINCSYGGGSLLGVPTTALHKKLNRTQGFAGIFRKIL